MHTPNTNHKHKNVWSASLLQEQFSITGVVCANVFGVSYERLSLPAPQWVPRRITLKNLKASISCFLCQVLIRWFYRLRLLITAHANPGYSFSTLNTFLYFNTDQTIRANLFTSVTQTTLKDLLWRSFTNHSPKTAPAVSSRDKMDLA